MIVISECSPKRDRIRPCASFPLPHRCVSQQPGSLPCYHADPARLAAVFLRQRNRQAVYGDARSVALRILERRISSPEIGGLQLESLGPRRGPNGTVQVQTCRRHPKRSTQVLQFWRTSTAGQDSGGHGGSVGLLCQDARTGLMRFCPWRRRRYPDGYGSTSYRLDNFV